MPALSPTMTAYNVSEDVDYYMDLTTIMVQRETAAEAATVSPASPGRLLSVDYPSYAISKLAGVTSTTTTTTATAIDYAVRNVSVALCHPSSGIPSVDEYFTGKSWVLIPYHVYIRKYFFCLCR